MLNFLNVQVCKISDYLITFRFTYQQIAMAELFKIKTAAERASVQMDEVLDSYTIPKSLAQYKVTPQNWYDDSLISKEMIGKMIFSLP